LERFARSKPRRFAQVSATAKKIVDFYADFQFPQGPLFIGAIGWKQKGQGIGHMRRNLMHDLFFDAGFVDQSNAALRQITDSAVEKAAGAAACAERKIVLFKQASVQSAHGRIPNDARANDTAANDKQVQRFFKHRLGGFCALLGESGHRAIKAFHEPHTLVRTILPHPDPLPLGEGESSTDCW
jgi:hypothetical protein